MQVRLLRISCPRGSCLNDHHVHWGTGRDRGLRPEANGGLGCRQLFLEVIQGPRSILCCFTPAGCLLWSAEVNRAPPQEGKEEVKPSESVHSHLISLLYLESSHGLTPAVPSKIPQSADERGTQCLLLRGKGRKEMGWQLEPLSQLPIHLQNCNNSIR